MKSRVYGYVYMAGWVVPDGRAAIHTKGMLRETVTGSSNFCSAHFTVYVFSLCMQ